MLPLSCLVWRNGLSVHVVRGEDSLQVLHQTHVDA